MKLYTNGCSFTHGHKDFGGCGDTDPIMPDSPPAWVWPSLLKNNFDEVVNQAWRGTGNNRIVRRTIDFLSTVNDPENWWIVIQWANLQRLEWFDDETNTWYTQLLHGAVIDDLAQSGLDPKNRPIIERKEKITIPYITEVRTDEEAILDLLYQTITLDTFLKAKGFNNVLYTSMSNNCRYKHHLAVLDKAIATDTVFHNQYISKNSPNINLFKQLDTLLDEDKFIKPISVVAKGHEESESDGHPNAEGHRIFSQYILNEMEKRNWQT